MIQLTATQTWRRLLADVLENGKPTAQDSGGADWRGRTSNELIAYQTVWPMDRAVVLCPERKLGYRFLAAEAAWVLSGSNRLDEIAPFAHRLVNLSDDGVFLTGAYGPMFQEQLPYVVQTLARDRASRQVVSTIWRSRPGPAKDIPCTLSLQWLIRRDGLTPEGHDGDLLHCVATMRSSDVWFGLPYDIHVFSMCSAYVALLMRDRLGPLRLGNLYVTAGSQHLYHLDASNAKSCAYEQPGLKNLGNGQLRIDEAFDLAPFRLEEFVSPKHLVGHLWAVANRDLDEGGPNWLRETVR